MLKRELNAKASGCEWLLLLWLLTQEKLFKFSVWNNKQVEKDVLLLNLADNIVTHCQETDQTFV